MVEEQERVLLDENGTYDLGEEEELAGIAASLTFMRVTQAQGGGGG
jgi:hypothetical protein